MIINTELPTKIVKDFDIAIMSGMVMPVTIDETLGDTFEELPDRFKIYLAPRPTLDASDVLPAEHIDIYKTHVVSVNHRTRKVIPRTPEEELLWKQSLREPSKTIH